ncbi:MAG: undecaprenyl/decaprenyl-phosphate alpha-N-acetylglucosaminyl 1-phosphate transferase [Paludibacteraceae bacterium]|nr:undecaprenyl/decaprenyl-phosphate alpha-N-acetylglucosaminyl 1-phosphate transferase [Paludibacteraceae bacterium]
MNYINHIVSQYPFIVFVVSFLIGLAFMPVVLDIARKHNFVVKPNKRTSHEGAIPNIGGINIFVSFFITVFLFSFGIFTQLQFIILGVLIILIVGFVDDLIDLKVNWKLLGELTAAFFLIVLSDIRLTNLHGFLGVYSIADWQSYLLSFFVFIVIINALNLIDGIDGLASGLGIIYSLFFAVYFMFTGNSNLAISAFAMAGSLGVFFIYNVFGTKNKIFMGDSGSLLLGYMITLYVFEFCEMNVYQRVPPDFYMASAPAVAICVLSVPLFDTLRVMLTRIKKGVSPFHPDRNHIHHLLLKTGLKHRQVTFVLMFISVIFIGLAVLARNWEIGFLVLIAFLLASVLTYILWRVVDRKNLGK